MNVESFNPHNFTEIYDNENRKGNDLCISFFPEIHKITKRIRTCKFRIRKANINRLKQQSSYNEYFLFGLNRLLHKLKSDKSLALEKALRQISTSIEQPNFKIKLLKKHCANNKPFYTTDKSPESFFTIKQLQIAINRIYKVKQSNRHDIICRLRNTLETSFPYEIVRTDIKSFYESIDHKLLVSKLEDDQLLGALSKKYIGQILNSYVQLSGSTKGIPRGVGISAYLSEIFMRPVDRDILKLPGLVMYGRYVDDIVAVFAKSPNGIEIQNYSTLIKDVLNKNQLEQNVEKTQIINLATDNPVNFTYLGYKFSIVKNKPLAVSPSELKLMKYSARIKASFAAYKKSEPREPRKSFRLLVLRIKYLTGNTRLCNSKSSAMVGVFFNNSHCSSTSEFKDLDTELKAHIEEIRRPSLRSRLKPFTFQSGFDEKRFHRFSVTQLEEIVSIWKYV